MKKLRIVNKRHLSLKYKRLFPDTGDRLWYFRQTLEWSQQEMADECGVNRGVVGDIERGYGLGQGRSLVKLARGMGISVDYLLSLSDTETIENKTRRKHG